VKETGIPALPRWQELLDLLAQTQSFGVVREIAHVLAVLSRKLRWIESTKPANCGLTHIVDRAGAPIDLLLW
jgi:hypothetical protein